MPKRTPGQNTLPAERLQRMTDAERNAYTTRRRNRANMRQVHAYQSYLSSNSRLMVPLIGGKRTPSGIFQGGVHEQPGAILGLVKRLKQGRVETAKKPTNEAQWCAVEIEFIAAGTWDVVTEALADAGLETCCHLKSDSSVEGNDTRGNPYELVVCAELGQMHSIIGRVCKTLRLPEVDAGINKTCGLHIHVDMRKHDVDLAYRNLVAAYPLLSKLVPGSRVRNEFCKPPDTSDFEDAESEGDRYRAINPMSYGKYKTLEIRIFGGTVRADKIQQYLKVVSSIAYTDTELPRNAPLQQFEEKLLWAKPLVDWVSHRAAEFGHTL